MDNLVIICADIGSVRSGNFGWASSDGPSGMDMHEFVAHIATCLDDQPVALGFECPLFVPARDEPIRLNSGRNGDGSRPWSAGAGTGVMATGLVQVLWTLRELRERHPEASAHVDWREFKKAGAGLFLWEAFVSGHGKPTEGQNLHVADAVEAIWAFEAALPDPTNANAIDETEVLSLIGTCLLRSGWTNDIGVLSKPCVVIKTDLRES